MNTLNLGSDEIPATKKKSNTRNLKIALGLAAVILVPTIGTTLAGTITVSGGSVEFGQGIAQTASCDANGITLTPAASFTNAAGAGSFGLGTITVSGIANLCTGKTFKISAYDAEGVNRIALSDGTPALVGFTPTISAADSGSCTIAEAPISNATYSACTYGLDANSVIITLQAGIDAEDIFKFTVETA